MKEFCLVVAVTCGFLFQGEVCSKDLSRHDGVGSTECVFEGERSIGIIKFRSRTVHHEARECLRGGLIDTSRYT